MSPQNKSTGYTNGLKSISPFITYLKERWKILCISTIITFIVVVAGRIIFPIQGTDFYVYYTASKDMLANGFTHTYSYSFWVGLDILPYRYLPSFLIIFSPLTLLPLAWNFVIYYIINMALVVICGFLLKNILALLDCKFHPGSKLKLVLDLLFFIVLPVETLVWGQVSIIVGTVSLASFYCFLKKRPVLGSFIFGITFIIKPVLIVLALLIVFALGPKGFFKRVIALVIPLVPDAAIFLLNRSAFQGFINLNVVGFMQNFGKFYSISFMNLLLLAGNSSIIFEGIAILACTIFGIVVAKRQANDRDKLLTIFTIGITSYLITFADVWLNQAFYIYAFLFIYIARFQQNNRKVLGIIFSYTILILFKFYMFSATEFFLNDIAPGFDTMTWTSAIAIIAASPVLVINLVFTIVTCAMSLPVFIGLNYQEITAITKYEGQDAGEVQESPQPEALIK
jgi:hypothetical protein